MCASNENLLARLASVWSEHDIEQLLELFTDDCVYEDVTLGWLHRGKPELRQFAKIVFTVTPDFQIRYNNIFATAGHGAADWLIEATWQGEFEGVMVGPRRLALRGASLFEFRNGRIARNRDYWDYASYMRQLNVLTLRSTAATVTLSAAP